MTETEKLLAAYKALAVHFAQYVIDQGEGFVKPEDGDWLRFSLETLSQMEPDKDRRDKYRQALWEPIFYENRYSCDECHHEWSDTATCMCSDECSTCGRDIDPTESLIVQS